MRTSPDAARKAAVDTRNMTEVHSSVDRLEARLDYLAGRVETLYSLLEARGIPTAPVDTGRSDALFDELVQIEDTPFARETRSRPRPPRRRPVSRLRVGSASGV
jgi:hypothetical protein